MISLLILLIALVVVVGIAWWIITQVPLPQPFRWLAAVLFGLIVLVGVLNYLPLPPGHLLR